MSKRVGVLTTGRQDWGILRSTCLGLRQESGFDFKLLVGGMHLSARFGDTVELLEQEGFASFERLPWSFEGTSASEQAGSALSSVGGALRRLQLDALLLAGDRYETMAGAVAATLERVPIIHLHGGEETQGAFDDALRHAITKLAHLHLVSHVDHAKRVIALGEDPATVHVVGAPGLDNVRRSDLADRAELEQTLGLPLRSPVVIVTLHPATLGGDPKAEAEAVVAAMEVIEATWVVTLPNADPGNEVTRRILLAATTRPGRVAVAALGERRFWGLMRVAAAMLGNSSSALIEAPVLGLPAVNVGDRQKGRARGENVVDAPARGPEIAAALRRVLSPEFRGALPSQGPFGDGRSAEKILSILRAWPPPHPPLKAPMRIDR